MAARTTNLLLADLATGESGVLGYANWGEAADDNFARLEDALTETSSIALTGSNVTLTDEQERSVYLKLTGTLTANVEVRTNDRKGFWFVHNGTSGSYTVTFKPTSGSGIVVPQGARIVLACDGTDIFAVTPVVRDTHECIVEVSGGNLVVLPHNGNRFTFPSGNTYTIPAAGWSLSPSGLTPGTDYYIYVDENGGSPQVVSSSTGHSTDSASGIEIETGDTDRVLVASCRPVTGPAFADSETQRLVISWFNRKPKNLRNSFTTTRSTSSGTLVEVNSEIRCEFQSWNEVVRAHMAASPYLTTGGAGKYAVTAIGLDGATALTGKYISANAIGANEFAPGAQSGAAVVSEGNHYITLIARQGGTDTVNFGTADTAIGAIIWG